VNALLDDADLRRTLEKNIRSFANADANRLIYERVVEAVEAYQKQKK
jgi:hypothetical protein